MRKITKRILLVTSIVSLVAIVIFVVFQFLVPSPCFSQEFVEEYVSKYSKDFIFIRNESYSIGLNGFKESDDTDWYFHDNEWDFDFHVKTLKSENSSGSKHIICNYYDYYLEKLMDESGLEIKKIVLDTFDEIYDNIEEDNISLAEGSNKISIAIEGQKNKNCTEERYTELCQTVSKRIFEYLEKYDPNLKNRSMTIGWDVDMNTDWSDTGKDFSIMIGGKIFKIKDYFNK